MPKVFFYKLIVDGNGAPCIDFGRLSLAICKPKIRTSAQVGDLVFGFAANGLDPDNRLIYAARVTEVLGREYYTDERFAGRGDRVYCWRGKRFEFREGGLHHGPGDLEHDLGSFPGYPKAKVLVSDDFRYFGAAGTADYKRTHPLVGRAVEDLGRGHRVNHGEALFEELLDLKKHLWKRYRRNVLGKPTSGPRANLSLRGRSCGVVTREGED